jgi:hypothetical protein
MTELHVLPLDPESERRLARMAGGIKRWTAPEMRELLEALERGGADYECLHAERYGLA